LTEQIDHMLQNHRQSSVVPVRSVSTVIFAFLVATSLASADDSVRWAGEGQYRLLVEVSPVDLVDRVRDEMPAEVEVNFARLLGSDRTERRVDATTFQVMRIDPQDGEPQAYDDYEYGRSRFDRPFAWRDAAIPYEFPEVFRPSSYSGGERVRQISLRAGYMYDSIGDWRQGRLAFSHTQLQHEVSRYAIYFDLLPAGEQPQQAPPQGWLGDGLPRRDIVGDSTTGSDDTKITLDDFDDDGLIDIVYGEQYGQLFVMPNRGTRTSPRFPVCKMLFEADGQPLDVGIHATPLIVDWDQDGTKDILAGTYQNSIAFFKNVGTNRERQFVYQGFIKDSDGAPLELPFRPVAEKPEGVFTHDYYPVMSAVDWNDDGRIDLLAGGYVTGRIYFYENIAQHPGQTPELHLQGPLHADGKPLNVRDWGAAPCIADINGDGLLDVVSGSYTWLPDKKEQPSFLRYYENIGTSAEPVLTEKPFPFRGELRSFRLPVPRAADLNDDGLIDLVVASGAEILLFRNIGTTTAPLFELHHDAIRSAWGNARLPGSQIVDYNLDGFPDLVSGYTVYLNSGAGNPYRFDKTANVLPPGVHIDHPVELGDGHFWPYLADLDGDRKLDVLFGDWHGHVWFHRNLSQTGESRFDIDGVKLKTENDQPIKVGPQNGDPERDFIALQGARTVFTVADYSGDGLRDLVVGDTYGKIRYFRNLGPTGSPTFAQPVMVGDLKFRLLVDSVDWNNDGRMDVLAGTDSHQISVFLNQAESDSAPFSAAIALSIPQIKETRVLAVDLNRDGDRDLFVMSTQGSILVERSFLNHGYAQSRVVTVVEQRPDNN
jgi:hypothetical protein